MEKKYDLEDRLVTLAVSILNLVEKLPNNPIGKHLGNQLIRSSTSSALNYGESQAAESSNDFDHKIKIVLKELRETQINLRIILGKADLISESEILGSLKECSELVAIFTSTVKKRKTSKLS